MADGFRGMRNDFVEFFNCVVGISCFSSVSFHEDDGCASLPPVPLPNPSGSGDLETGFEAGLFTTLEDSAGSPFAGTAPADGCTDTTFPQVEQVDDNEGLDSSFSSFRDYLCSTTEDEDSFSHVRLNNKDSEYNPSLQIIGEKSKEQRRLKRRWGLKSSGFMHGSSSENVVAREAGEGVHFDSASDTKLEDDEFSIRKHFPNQWTVMEDHIPFLDKNISRDSHLVGDCDYVILKRS